MKIYPKQNKDKRGNGDFFFGNWNNIPIGLSYTVVTEKNIADTKKDNLHYHKKGSEFYFVIEGKAILEIEGKDFEIEKDKLIMVDPGEKHFVKEISELPFKMLVINDIKDKEDKIVL